MSTQKIRKVVIPAAGFGTRFLPATKAQPKEMLPVVDKPVIQYVVEEAVASGITDIILVTGANKRSLEDHFDYNYELQSWLKKQGKELVRQEMKKIADMANFIYIRQKGPYGNGTPVWCAREVVGNEPFAVMWADEFYDTKKPRLKQLIEVYEKYGDPVLTLYPVEKKDVSRYGIVDGKELGNGVYKVNKIVEKPSADKAPSQIATLGGYILTPDIFDVLAEQKAGKGGEVWLTDAIFALSKKRAIYGKLIEGTYYDTGSKLGWMKANIEMGLKHPEVKDELREYLKKLKK